MKYQITLTEAEEKAMEYVSVSVQEWIDNAVKSRAKAGIDEIVKLFVDHALNNNIPIPTSKDEIVLKAYELAIVKTAQQSNDEYIKTLDL